MNELLEYLILQNMRNEAMLRALMAEIADLKSKQRGTSFENEMNEMMESFRVTYKTVISSSPNAEIFAKSIMDSLNLKYGKDDQESH